MFRALFLDVGGTLLTEVPPRFEIYAEAARARGLAVDGARMAELMRGAHRELPDVVAGDYRYGDAWFEAFIARIFGDRLGLDPSRLPALTEELFARFEDPATFRLFDGATALLRDLRGRGVVCGVVSNWSARLPRVLERTGLGEHLDFALSSALVGAEKPDPAIFREALERAGVRPAEAVHAGDHPVRDVEGARRVGIDAVLVDHAGAANGAAGTVVGSLPELHALLLERLP